jgi:hypothetical protein
MKTTNKFLVCLGFVLAIAGLVIIFDTLYLLPFKIGVSRDILLPVQYLLSFGGASIIAVGYMATNWGKYYSIEEMKDGTQFTILHMASIDEQNPTMLRMGISVGDDVFLFKTTTTNFQNQNPTLRLKYTKVRNVFVQL